MALVGHDGAEVAAVALALEAGVVVQEQGDLADGVLRAAGERVDAAVEVGPVVAVLVPLLADGEDDLRAGVVEVELADDVGLAGADLGGRLGRHDQLLALGVRDEVALVIGQVDVLELEGDLDVAVGEQGAAGLGARAGIRHVNVEGTVGARVDGGLVFAHDGLQEHVAAAWFNQVGGALAEAGAVHDELGDVAPVAPDAHVVEGHGHQLDGHAAVLGEEEGHGHVQALVELAARLQVRDLGVALALADELRELLAGAAPELLHHERQLAVDVVHGGPAELQLGLLEDDVADGGRPVRDGLASDGGVVDGVLTVHLGAGQAPVGTETQVGVVERLLHGLDVPSDSVVVSRRLGLAVCFRIRRAGVWGMSAGADVGDAGQLDDQVAPGDQVAVAGHDHARLRAGADVRVRGELHGHALGRERGVAGMAVAPEGHGRVDRKVLVDMPPCNQITDDSGRHVCGFKVLFLKVCFRRERWGKRMVYFNYRLQNNFTKFVRG